MDKTILVIMAAGIFLIGVILLSQCKQIPDSTLTIHSIHTPQGYIPAATFGETKAPKNTDGGAGGGYAVQVREIK